jgi:hypothetical protein
MPRNNHQLRLLFLLGIVFSSSPCLSSENVPHYNFSSLNTTSLGSPFSAGGYNANAMTGVDNGSIGRPFAQTSSNSNNDQSKGYVGFNFSTIDKGGAAFSHEFTPEHTDASVQPQAAMKEKTNSASPQNSPSPFAGAPQSFSPLHSPSPQEHKSFQPSEPQDLQPAP